MSFGIGWKVWNLKHQRACPRCSLKYDRSLSKCPHCGDLDSNSLAELKIQIEQNHRANTKIGKLFVLLAIVLMIGLVLINSQA